MEAAAEPPTAARARLSVHAYFVNGHIATIAAGVVAAHVNPRGTNVLIAEQTRSAQTIGRLAAAPPTYYQLAGVLESCFPWSAIVPARIEYPVRSLGSDPLG